MKTSGNQRVVVYTCITGGYDELTAPAHADPEIDYVCFSDGETSPVAPWRMIDVRHLAMTAKDRNRYVKMHPHLVLPEHDVSIYVDGSIRIVGNLRPFLASCDSRIENILLYDHPERSCAYAEGAACAHFAHDWIWRITRQLSSYRKAGFPENYGLFEAGVIIRRNTSEMRVLMEAWWAAYSTGVRRDQLTLPFLSWQSGVRLGSLGSSDPRKTRRFFAFVDHPRRFKLRIFLIRLVNRLVEQVLGRERLFGLRRIDSGKRSYD
jgi:hypothetical protein